jgi:hypothetical protein
LRIDVVTLISGFDERALERRRQSLSSYASPGIEVRLVTTGNYPHPPKDVGLPF